MAGRRRGPGRGGADEEDAAADAGVAGRVGGGGARAVVCAHRGGAPGAGGGRRGLDHRRRAREPGRGPHGAAAKALSHPARHLPRLPREPVARGRVPAGPLALQPDGRAGRDQGGKGEGNGAAGGRGARDGWEV